MTGAFTRGALIGTHSPDPISGKFQLLSLRLCVRNPILLLIGDLRLDELS
jgi:hypothetical protein